MLPTSDSFWLNEDNLLWGEVDDLALSGILAGAKSGAALLPPGAQQLINQDLFNQGAITFLQEYNLTAIPGINNTTRRKAVEVVGQWLTSGESLQSLEGQLAPLFGSQRAAMIASTETTRMFAVGNEMIWNSTGLIGAKQWRTARDERVCFPAWTMVDTDNGRKPIQTISVGDIVLTRDGYKRVKAVSKRKYTGSMTTIKAKGKALTGTSDHPVLVDGKWKDLGSIRPGDFVYSVGDKDHRIGSTFDFIIGNPHNSPTVLGKVVVFPLVFVLGMPVNTVNFKSNFIVSQKKVNRVSSNLGLLNIGNTHAIKRHSNEFFEKVLALKSTIASHRAKLFFIAGDITKSNTTVFTGYKDGRPSAFLRAKMAVEVLFSPKGFAASFTVNISRLFGSARSTAKVIPVFVYFLYNKWLTALRANLSNHYGGAVGIVTGSTTKRPFFSGRDIVEPSATESTVSISSTSLSLRLRSLYFVVIGRHIAQLLSNIGLLYHRLCANGITVYDIQVEDKPEFYANGILVHNCPICGPLDGKITGLNGVFELTNELIANSPQMKNMLGSRHTEELAMRRAQSLISSVGVTIKHPPAHPRCRCWESPVVSEDLFRDEIVGILNG